jgi:cobalt transporter subunit CbtA
MIFSRIIYSAILVGLITGVLLSSLQIASLNPIIFTAEDYQSSAAESHSHNGVDGHSDHGLDGDWVPANGFERTAFTFVANILLSTGFAAIMLALMNQCWLMRGRAISWSQGSLWGLAGFTVVFLAPALGLPPEIPGQVAVPVEHRQVWWLLTALSVAIGLGILAFTSNRVKALGLLLLVIPYVVGVPRVEGPMFTHPDPDAVQALVYLQQQFVVISGITNLVYWLVLGLVCRFAFDRWLRNVPYARD